MASHAVLEAAERCHALGLCPLPIRADGSKAPAVESWSKDERLPWSELLPLFRGEVGLALVCGPVSGNLELLDFDSGDLFEPWLEQIESQAPQLPQQIIILSTPRGGFHVPYWVEGQAVPGNHKIAMAPALNAAGQMAPKTLIETRGYGGYYLTHPSPPACHELNKPYTWVQGSYEEIPTLSWAERELLHTEAASFNLWVPPERRVTRHAARDFLGDRPGDIFNREADIAAWLAQRGWTWVRDMRDGSCWRRPGKEKGISATLDIVAPGIFHVFSTNAYPFEHKHGYDAFGVFSLLEAGGDFELAAKKVRAMGYYDRDAKPNPAVRRGEEPPPPEEEKASEGEELPRPRVDFVWHRARDYELLPPPEWAIYQLLEKRELVCLYGLSGHGKSFLGLEWSFRLAQGGDWCGRKVEGGNVFYMNLDGGAGLRKRVAAWRRVNGISAPHDVFLTENFLDLREASSTGALILSIQRAQAPCEWLVIDTLSQAIAGADEISTRDMSMVVKSLTHLRERLACGILLLAHSDKAGTSMRGVASIYNAAATVIRADLVERIMTLTCEKQRNDDKFPPLRLTLQKDGDSATLLVPGQHLAANPVKAAQQLARAELLESIVRFVAAREKECRLHKDEGCRATARMVMSSLQLDQKRTSDYLRELVAAGRVSHWKRPQAGGLGFYHVFGVLQASEFDCAGNRAPLDGAG